MGRLLKSKKLRQALWRVNNGKCGKCGRDLPDNWHADHRVPWWLTHRTNVHEMQALCPACNLEKGERIVGLRAHQTDFLTLCREILAGLHSTTRQILVDVTPGGGKSLIPVIAASVFIPRKADAICWVVPRESLRDQAEETFLAEFGRRFLAHGHKIRASTNDVDPCRDTSGYVTTYQAIGANPDLHSHEFGRKRYILVLDEPHHVEEGGPWHRALQKMVEQAWITVFMSGTFERGDGKPIAFVPYTRRGGRLTVDFMPGAATKVVRYRRRDALTEQAIKPLIFKHVDGYAQYIERDGTERVVDSLAESGKEASSALYAALNSAYAHQLLFKAADDWTAYRRSHPRSKLLVVAHGITAAKDYLKQLAGRGINRVAIATSEDSVDAKLAIARFKSHDRPDSLDVLVTVAMAYEGLDVPAITHIACLTHIRSKPWIEQMLARAGRVDYAAGPYQEQYGYIYCPDDPLFNECIAEIKAEQDPFLRERLEIQRQASLSGDRTIGGIVPLQSQTTRTRVSDLQNGEQLDYDLTRTIEKALEDEGLIGVDPMQFYRAAQRIGITIVPEQAPIKPISPVTPSQEERKIRTKIHKHTGAYERAHGLDHGTINREMLAYFGKPRSEMTVSELRDAWAWVQARYPLEVR